MVNDKQLTKIIYNWVKKSYGRHEADDSSWNIELLSEEIIGGLEEGRKEK